MNKNTLNYGDARFYFIHALTPLHVGAGQGTGFIDLPIMREKTTGWPLVPGSSVKGVWLDYAKRQDIEESMIEVAFGKAEGKPEDDHAGSFAITDARILLLPVRSFYGTFAYVTSPLVLTRLIHDMKSAGVERPAEVPEIESENNILITRDSVLKGENADGFVFLEDLDFKGIDGHNTVEKWANYFGNILFEESQSKMLKRRFGVIPDSAFDYFSQHGTEVNARIRIQGETKIVAKNALWNEEYLPAETVLAGIVWCDQVYGLDLNPGTLLDHFFKEALVCQMGGKFTIGKGRVRCLFKGGKN